MSASEGNHYPGPSLFSPAFLCAFSIGPPNRTLEGTGTCSWATGEGVVILEGTQEKIPSADTCSFRVNDTEEDKHGAIFNGVYISSKYSLMNEIHFLKLKVKTEGDSFF